MKVEPSMWRKVAIQGCCHGELDKIYASLLYIQEKQGIKIDLLIICGDFQAIRNQFDLSQMAVPLKYQKLGNFHEYYSKQKIAPIPTIFIGGNHEASNYLWELYYGGYVAENIFFLGHSGVVNFKGMRIGGLSGIYNDKHYNCGYFEEQPLNSGHLRSIYHVRRLSVFRLANIKKPLDIMLSHDWPRGIAKHGDTAQLLKRKGFLKREIADNSLGSPPCEFLLGRLKPKYWFSAHLHVKFPAIVRHENSTTKFLALDKCMPNRDFLQIIDVKSEQGNDKFEYDQEWIAILKATHDLFSKNYTQPDFPPEEIIARKIKDMEAFVAVKSMQVVPFKESAPSHPSTQEGIYSNPQTEEFCKRFEIGNQINIVVNPDEIELSDASSD